MSIINSMHKNLDELAQNNPVLSGQNNSKTKQKVLLSAGIVLLIICAVVLLVMIFLTKNNEDNADTIRDAIKDVTVENVIKGVAVEQAEQVPSVLASEQSMTKALDNESHHSMLEKNKPLITSKSQNIETTSHVNKVAKGSAKLKDTASHKSTSSVLSHSKTISSKKEGVINASLLASELTSGHLHIEPAQLSNVQIANIYLKEATKAQAKGDNDLAAEKWQKALNVNADLNDVRKSLAMYHYSQNDVDKTTRLLKKGAVISPEYSDFNLMLSRIALKNNDPQKALLYLEQNPPQIKGNIDYYVSHAILAQKFKMYERSETLYSSLLTLRPNNGRWLMSLAISQDKQAKSAAAITSYKAALKKVDLSIKAKDYINKRLTFLSKG